MTMRPVEPEVTLPKAVDRMRRVLRDGARRYPDERWKRQSVLEHLSHALEHLKAHGLALSTGIKSGEDDIGHALIRLAMAIQLGEDE